MRTKSYLLIILLAGMTCAQAAYYQGSYPSDDSGTAAPANNDNAPPENPAPPPVVYRRVPVYRRPVYRAPAWAAPNAAALAPWPWSFEFGGGPTVAGGSTLTSGSNFLVGGGYNFSPRTGLMLEFSNNWLGLSDAALADAGADDGHAQVWSVTLNPIYRFRLGGPFGAYVIGGGGYYEQEKTFFVPGVVVDPFFGPIAVEQEFDNTDHAGGVNVGAGLTLNMGWGTKFFIEARYHHLFLPGGGTNIIPITFGIRW